MGRVGWYAAGAVLIATGLLVAVVDIATMGFRGLDNWSDGLGSYMLYAVLADATVVLGVMIIRRTSTAS